MFSILPISVLVLCASIVLGPSIETTLTERQLKDYVLSARPVKDVRKNSVNIFP